MEFTRRQFMEMLAAVAGTAAAGTIAGCSSSSSGSGTTGSSSGSSAGSPTGSLELDDSAWGYDADNDVYWQVGVTYCTNPATTDYETMGIYVPGAYMSATANSDGTYTCSVDTGGAVGSYTAATAPIVIPVNTAGYSAQAAPAEYSSSGITDYLSEGFVYLYPGLRGRDNGYDSSDNLAYSGGAPWGVTDLKAAIRYYRYNASKLPGDVEKVFTFGHSGGGAQSAVTGASGDSPLFGPYLEAIGAAMEDASGNALSDATCGAMCWCPITSLDYADEAYEWNMGQWMASGTRASGTWTRALSDDLSTSFAEYINGLNLKDASGNLLALEASSNGIYDAGSYYDYLVGVVETSLNHFLSDTTFPYTPSSQTMADGGFGGGGQGAPDSSGASGSTSGSVPSGSAPSGSAPSAPSGSSSGSAPSGSAPSAPSGSSSGSAPSGSSSGSTPSGMASTGTGSASSSTTYDTAQDYIDSLNADGAWISYDSASNTATIAGMGEFVTCCKNASKDVCAFDDLNRGQAENNLFGNDENDYLHFDATAEWLLESNADAYSAYSDFDSSYAQAYASDLEQLDGLGNDVPTRVDIYNPMYYACEAYEGYGTSAVARHWRIRTGIEQGDTALTVETNLALALAQNSDVSDVDFETVWGLGHTTAERTGDSTTNFINWVKGF